MHEKCLKFKFQYCLIQVCIFLPKHKEFYYLVKFSQSCLAVMTRQHAHWSLVKRVSQKSSASGWAKSTVLLKPMKHCLCHRHPQKSFYFTLDYSRNFYRTAQNFKMYLRKFQRKFTKSL